MEFQLDPKSRLNLGACVGGGAKGDIYMDTSLKGISPVIPRGPPSDPPSPKFGDAHFFGAIAPLRTRDSLAPRHQPECRRCRMRQALEIEDTERCRSNSGAASCRWYSVAVHIVGIESGSEADSATSNRWPSADDAAPVHALKPGYQSAVFDFGGGACSSEKGTGGAVGLALVMGRVNSSVQCILLGPANSLLIRIRRTSVASGSENI